MGMFDPVKRALLRLWPRRLQNLAGQQLSDLIESEAVRARLRVEDLARRFPSATPKELAQHLIEQKKQVAGMVGGVTGVFGLITVPVDLMGMVYLQLALLTEVATAFKVNLRGDRERIELLDLFGYANGIGPVQRAGPRVVGGLAALVLARTGLQGLSRAMPLVAAPISAYLNNQHIQSVGDAAIRHYEGWVRAHEKARNAAGPSPAA